MLEKLILAVTITISFHWFIGVENPYGVTSAKPGKIQPVTTQSHTAASERPLLAHWLQALAPKPTNSPSREPRR
jgi:hypothetical protein